jgi:NitT/TauT family transport system substrate-binding protein
MPSRRAVVKAGVAGALGVIAPRLARAAPKIRIGVLRFGSFSWALDVVRRHGFDTEAGVALDIRQYAGSPAAQVALQAGEVDIILQDWLWVARQRTGGADWSFVPFSSALGAVILPAGSPVQALADLSGRRLGVAGSALDKSWIILRAYAERHDHLDLARRLEPSFGAPALLAEELRRGRLDAALTFWPFAARAEASGMRTLMTMKTAVAGLGIAPDVPFVGYVFRAPWARAERQGLAGFLACMSKAQDLLASSDAEWETLAPLAQAANAAELAHLRDAYRAGIPRLSPEATAAAAATLFAVLAETGGPALVGEAKTLAPGTFWQTGLS